MKRYSKIRTGLFSSGIPKIHNNPVSKVLNTNGNNNFIKGRKYDTDMDRLSRRKVQNELSTESNNMNKELNKIRKEFKIL